jgi:hypothetical protein
MRSPRRAIQVALAFYSGAPMPQPAKPRKNSRPEAACLVEVIKTLRGHPAVAWCERQNSGAFRDGKRFVRFGWPGCSDVLGQLRDGRFLAVEVKAPGGRASDAQRLFLDRVRAAGGIAFIATNATDVIRNLAQEAP